MFSYDRSDNELFENIRYKFSQLRLKIVQRIDVQGYLANITKDNKLLLRGYEVINFF